jgi:hypothetical protein
VPHLLVFPVWQFQIALLPFGYASYAPNVPIEMDRSIVRRLIGTLHLVETTIPRFRIGHLAPLHQNVSVVGQRCTDCEAMQQAPFDTVLWIASMNLSLEDAMAANRAKVSGSATLLRKLPQLFDLAERRRGVTTAT